jgi:hypothetical protein
MCKKNCDDHRKKFRRKSRAKKILFNYVFETRRVQTKKIKHKKIFTQRSFREREKNPVESSDIFKMLILKEKNFFLSGFF